jgi:type III secretion protein T
MNEVLPQVASIADYGHLLKGVLQLLAVCTLRVYALFVVLPATADSSLQGPVRNGVCLTIGIYIAWGQPLQQVMDMQATALLMLLAKELLLGLLLGYAAAVVFWVAEGVGVLIDNQAGFNNVQQTNPLSGEQSTPVGNLLSQLAISGFYMLGGMVVLVGLLFQSFAWWPLNSLGPAWPTILEDFVRFYTGRYLAQVVQVAAPVLLVLLLVDLGVGLLSKSAEKLEPNALGQPIKGAVALTMLSLLVVVFFDQVRPTLSLQTLAAELAQWAKAIPPAR